MTAGVVEAEVNFATGKAHVVMEPDGADVEALRQAVDRIGFDGDHGRQAG